MTRAPDGRRGTARVAAGIALLAAAPAAAQDWTFVDASAELGLALANAATSWADVDGDGWVDLNAGGQLWLNRAGVAFTTGAALAPGVFADFDNDGDLDLFAHEGQRLFLNDGRGEFTERALPELPRTSSRGAACADLDGDGWVDVYVGGYERWDDQVTYPDHVLRNEGGGSLALAREDARYRARGVAACDFDEDGDVDVYVSNYRLQPNVLWRNDGAGGLADVAASLGALATSPGFAGGHSIGAAWGDFDGDGHFDLFAGNFAHVDDRGDQPKSRFLRNLGEERGFAFEDRGTCGVHYQESYASPAAADFDNDGDLDLWFTTVYGTASFGRPNHPVLFRNDGDWTFTDVTAAHGLASLPPTYQAAWADFDRDGDLDLATAGKLFRNAGGAGRGLGLRLVGDRAGLNRAAVGARVRVRSGDVRVTRQVEAGTGEGNQNDLALHFGLGATEGTVAIEIAWPDGRVDRRADQPVGPALTLRASEAE